MKSFSEFLESKAEEKGCKEYQACVREKSKDPDVDDPEIVCAGIGGKGKRSYRLRRRLK